MRGIKISSSINRIAASILLCFYPAQVSAQPDFPKPTAFSAEWLPVYPQVAVNGTHSDGLFKFMEHNGRIFAQVETLAALGIYVPSETLTQARRADASVLQTASETIAANGDNGFSNSTEQTVTELQSWLALESIAELNTEYDAARQALSFTAPLAWLNLPISHIKPDGESAYTTVRSDFAGIFNYDFNLSRNGEGRLNQALLTETRLATPAGYLSHNQYWQRGASQSSSAQRNNIRLDTYWRSVWPEQGLALTAGDLLTSQLGGGGSSRIGGIKLEHTYTLQPWRNTAPLRSYLGETTLPGTVDLYLNGVKQYSRQVSAGQYEIILPPTISGSSTARIITTDILGRTVVVDMPLYGGSGMLAKGLKEWSLEAGYLRRQYGKQSFNYGKNLVGSGTFRYGINHYLTAQIHAEGGGGHYQAGLAASTVLGSLGQMNASYARSSYQENKGRQTSISFSTQKRGLSFGAGWSRTDDRFTGVGVIANPSTYRPEGTATRTASASLGVNSNLWGSFNLSYLHSRYQKNEEADKIGVLSWHRNLGQKSSLFLSVSNNFNHTKQRSIHAGASMSLDKGYSATVAANQNNDRSNNYRLSLGKSGSGLGSTTWHVGWQKQTHAKSTNKDHINGYLGHNTQYGDGRVSVYHTKGLTNWDAGWNGGLVLMRNGLFATRTINESFAVVSTDGIADVPVSLANNKVGATDRRGLLLVPNLLAFQKNNLDIDITDLPLDIQADRARIQAVPSERSGVTVNFKLNRMHAASLTLKDGQGQLIPGGSSIISENGTPVAVVGFEGKTFIDHLTAGNNRFTVIFPENNGNCRFTLKYQKPPSSDGLPDLGETICTQ